MNTLSKSKESCVERKEKVKVHKEELCVWVYLFACVHTSFVCVWKARIYQVNTWRNKRERRRNEEKEKTKKRSVDGSMVSCVRSVVYSMWVQMKNIRQWTYYTFSTSWAWLTKWMRRCALKPVEWQTACSCEIS